jgi:hypothetical protein
MAFLCACGNYFAIMIKAGSATLGWNTVYVELLLIHLHHHALELFGSLSELPTFWEFLSAEILSAGTNGTKGW